MPCIHHRCDETILKLCLRLLPPLQRRAGSIPPPPRLCEFLCALRRLSCLSARDLAAFHGAIQPRAALERHPFQRSSSTIVFVSHALQRACCVEFGRYALPIQSVPEMEIVGISARNALVHPSWCFTPVSDHPGAFFSLLYCDGFTEAQKPDLLGVLRKLVHFDAVCMGEMFPR